MTTLKDQVLSATDAKRQFSALLRRVEQGESAIITADGKPVARLTPYRDAAEPKDRASAWDRLMALLDPGLPLGGGTFNRDELYDR
jgi:prevent-host-death family protein